MKSRWAKWLNVRGFGRFFAVHEVRWVIHSSYLGHPLHPRTTAAVSPLWPCTFFHWHLWLLGTWQTGNWWAGLQTTRSHGAASREWQTGLLSVNQVFICPLLVSRPKSTSSFLFSGFGWQTGLFFTHFCLFVFLILYSYLCSQTRVSGPWTRLCSSNIEVKLPAACPSLTASYKTTCLQPWERWGNLRDMRQKFYSSSILEHMNVGTQGPNPWLQPSIDRRTWNNPWHY